MTDQMTTYTTRTGESFTRAPDGYWRAEDGSCDRPSDSMVLRWALSDLAEQRAAVQRVRELADHWESLGVATDVMESPVELAEIVRAAVEGAGS